MNRFVTIAAIVATLSVIAIAAQAQEFNAVEAPTPTPELLNKLERTCEDGAFVLSLDAKVACLESQFPRLVADGSRFRNAGVGAEFNTLMRQLPTETAAAE